MDEPWFLPPENSKMCGKRSTVNAWEREILMVGPVLQRLSLQSPSLEGKSWKTQGSVGRVTGVRGMLETGGTSCWDHIPCLYMDSTSLFQHHTKSACSHMAPQYRRRFRVTSWETESSNTLNLFIPTWCAVLIFFFNTKTWKLGKWFIFHN